jgi:hypothetical protein
MEWNPLKTQNPQGKSVILLGNSLEINKTTVVAAVRSRNLRAIRLRCSLVKPFGFCAILLSATGLAANPTATPPQVNGQRLVQHLESLSEYGKNPQGGVSRVAYTAADKAGRE